MKNNARKTPIIVEHYPLDYDGPQFLSIIESFTTKHTTKDKEYLEVHNLNGPAIVIIDNTNKFYTHYYDLERAAGKEMLIVEQATMWFDQGCKVPLSIFISQNGLSDQTQHCHFTMLSRCVDRVIGPLFKFDMVCGTPKKQKMRMNKGEKQPPKLAFPLN